MRKNAIAIVLLSLVGLCPASEQELPLLESSAWVLSHLLDPSGSMQAVPPEVRISIQLRQGEARGRAGCNSYFGTYTWRPDGRLAFSSNMGTTMMACPPPTADLEQRYLALLPSVTRYRLHGGRLTLMDGEQATLEYRAHAPLGLEETPWRASGINNGLGGVVSRSTTRLATARFSAGRLTGSAGCNQFNAAYETDDGGIIVGPAAATRRHCSDPAGIMDQEQQYLQALERARTYKIEFDRLELRDESGALQLSFVVDR